MWSQSRANNSQDSTETKFKIELNKELHVKHLLTTLKLKDKFKEGRLGHEVPVEVPNPKLIESPCCYLDFKHDLLQFEFNVKGFHWKKMSNVKKSVCLERLNSEDHVKIKLGLPIVVDETEEDSNFILVNIDANVKNKLLDLFSSERKEFKLTVDYVVGSMDQEMKYQSIFNATIPNITQKEWNARKHRAGLYLPEITGRLALVRLFKNNFCLSVDYADEEAELKCLLHEYIDSTTKQKFSNFNFLKIFKIMLVIADLENIKEMEDFDMTFQKVSHFSSSRLGVRESVVSRLKSLMCKPKMEEMLKGTFIVEVTKDLPYDVQSFDYIYLTDMQDYQQFHDNLHEIDEYRILGKVLHIFGGFVLFKRAYKSRREAKIARTIDESRPYHISFQPNRIANRVAQQAVDTAITNQLSKYLKDFPTRGDVDKKPKETTHFDFMNPSIAGNKEQKSAVKNIFNRTCFPSPYIIFGPPGTGKSTTVVEAIAQIVKLKPNAHVLVTAGSNSACDDIGNRLLNYVSVNKILRLYSPSFDLKPEKIDKALEPISNFRRRYTCKCKRRSCPEESPLDDPTYEEIYTARVIVSTLINCGRIFSAAVKSDHFDYIFIDEAASECEQYSLVPIAGLGSGANGVVTAQIVLSGDHKQLGPIVPSKFCCKMGMEKSMMERIMQTNVNYQRGVNFNSKFVTQLVKNYRSHAAILQFSNENFYDSKLEFKCPRKIANFALGWELLNNKDFPLLFHSTRTASTRVGLSLKNEGEVNVLSCYIEALLLGINGKEVKQSDIGIISPYRAQRDRMAEQFSDEYPEIEIGTVDAFQGREKKIIIMSTVRSGTNYVGFLRNEKRLNVALTRAKCLLIIVGNSATLQKCRIWNSFISYCDNNSAIVGDPATVNNEVIHDQNYEGVEEIPDEGEDKLED